MTRILIDEGVMSDTEFLSVDLDILQCIYQSGRRYTQGGVVFAFFKDAHYRQRKLFDDSQVDRVAAKPEIFIFGHG